MEKSPAKAISRQALSRMPYYLEQLHKLREAGTASVTASDIARLLQLNEVQVRKDLAAVCSTSGRPRTGFSVAQLITDIEEYLGRNNSHDAVLVGAGHLGQALLSYSNFAAYGMNIIVAFDLDPALAGQTVNGKMILPLEKLASTVRRLGARIGVITVPAPAAQEVCDMLVKAGAQAIWNFAPTTLTVPEGVFLQNENMAASLALLAKHLDG